MNRKRSITLMYTERALADLESLDRPVARRIVTKLKDITDTSTHPLERAKSLSGPLSGLHRFRVGDYRVIVDLDERGVVWILLVLRVQHRKEVYR